MFYTFAHLKRRLFKYANYRYFFNLFLLLEGFLLYLCINYIRASSIGQKDDLLRQETYIKKKYQNNILIKDIGSGINMNRRGLRKIIYLAVIVHKDRLTRFGFDLIKYFIKKYSKGDIIILDKKKIRNLKKN